MLVLLWKFPEGNSGVDSISPFDFAPEVELDMSITRPMAEIKEATQLKVPTQIAVGTPQFCSTHGVTRVLTTDPGFIEKEERQSLIAISRNVIRLKKRDPVVVLLSYQIGRYTDSAQEQRPAHAL